MRIIHLILGKANPNRMNGVNKLVNEMLSTQKDLGFDVELWGITKNPEHNYPERNYNTVLFPMLNNKMLLHSSLTDATLKIYDSTVFHFHGSFIPEFYHMAKLLVKQGIPYVYTPHGALAPAALNKSRLKKQVYFKLFEKWLIENAACLVATGDSVFENAPKLARLKRNALIPNGQPIVPHQSNKRINDHIIFGFCGRIAMEHKGLDLLLEGYKIFKEQGGKGMLHLIGGGEEFEAFKLKAYELGVLNQLKLYGAKYGADKFEALSKFDVFVHTSRMEGFPASVLEAAALGLPLLVSKHTNVWDHINQYNCGLLVDPNTPEMIADQMKSFELLFNLKKLSAMKEGAVKMVKERFDWEGICKQYYQIYQEAIEEIYAEA